MSSDLLEENQSINAIYGDDTLSPLSKESSTSALYSLTLPSQPSISLRLEFPPNYPDAPPSILGTQAIGDNIPKGTGSQIVDIIREVLAEVYIPGSPCIFDLIEESSSKLQHLGLDSSAGTGEEESQSPPQTSNGQDPTSSSYEDAEADLRQTSAGEDLGAPPPWVLSDVISEKKSVFVARAVAVESVGQAQTFLAHLLSTDKKVAKATHNITAWRIQGEGGVQYQDCDDDGETAAGGRLLHLLELMGVWGVMVVVTRWYGGVHLGADRFRIINMCGRDAVVKGGFEAPAKGEGKKGKGGKEEEKKEKRSEFNSKGRFRDL